MAAQILHWRKNTWKLKHKIVGGRNDSLATLWGGKDCVALLSSWINIRCYWYSVTGSSVVEIINSNILLESERQTQFVHWLLFVWILFFSTHMHVLFFRCFYFISSVGWVSECVLFVLDSLQLKKLVYVYLVRYAEEQQDLALLSISTFQRALKVPYCTWTQSTIKLDVQYFF